MLCTVAAHAVVFARIAKAKVPLKGTLLFCAVSDEEAGGKDGAGCVLAFSVSVWIRTLCGSPPPVYALAHADRSINYHYRFLMTDPALREVFRADYCMTEVGGPTLIDRYGRPTKTYVQVCARRALPR